ncbi:MAG: Fe-S cluster assembly ATPase SufC [Actinomycetota bacterium]
MSHQLVITDLHVSVGEKEILKGLSLTVSSGEVHVVMGPNGSGKSTLAHALTGRPGYHVTSGSATLDGVELLHIAPWERVRAGLFLALQQPMEVPGVRPSDMLIAAGADPQRVANDIRREAQAVGLPDSILERFVNVDLSGGERKRAEIVQLGVLRPHVAILDEIDSGLDVDALGMVARRLQEATTEWDLGVLAITHFRRLLQELTPDVIHVMSDGRIVTSGGPELVEVLERDGYEPFRQK